MHKISLEMPSILFYMFFQYLNILYLFIFSQKSCAHTVFSTLLKAQKLSAFQIAICSYGSFFVRICFSDIY